MSLDNNFVATLKSTNASKTFALTSSDASGSTRIDTSTTLSEPRLMVVKHQLTVAKSGSKIDRHLLQFSETKYDANGVPQTVPCGLTIPVPRSSVITEAVIFDQLDFLRQVLSYPDILRAILRGER